MYGFKKTFKILLYDINLWQLFRHEDYVVQQFP